MPNSIRPINVDAGPPAPRRWMVLLPRARAKSRLLFELIVKSFLAVSRGTRPQFAYTKRRNKMLRSLLWTLCAVVSVVICPVMASAGSHGGTFCRFLGFGWSDGYHAHNLCCGCGNACPAGPACADCSGCVPPVQYTGPVPAPLAPAPAYGHPMPVGPVVSPPAGVPTQAAPPGVPTPAQPTQTQPTPAVASPSNAQSWMPPSRSASYSPVRGVYLPAVSHGIPIGQPRPPANAPAGPPIIYSPYGQPYGSYPASVPVPPARYPIGR